MNVGKAALLMAAGEDSTVHGNRLASKFGMGLSSDDLAQRDNDEQSKVYYSLHLTGAMPSHSLFATFISSLPGSFPVVISI